MVNNGEMKAIRIILGENIEGKVYENQNKISILFTDIHQTFVSFDFLYESLMSIIYKQKQILSMINAQEF